MPDHSQRACVYCGQDDVKLSGEHIISKVVLQELFGKNIENLTSTKFDNEWKRLPNYEATRKDVCEICNSRLSIYDAAGARFVREINKEHDKDLIILPFDQNVWGWIVKTNLNIIREKQKIDKTKIIINPVLYKNLLEGMIIPTDKIRLRIKASNLEPEFWRTDKRAISVMQHSAGSIQANNHTLILSELRIKYLEFSLILPIEGGGESFEADFFQGETILVLTEPYKRNVDIPAALSKQKLEISRDFPREEFLKGLMLMDDYEALFNSSSNKARADHP